MIKTSLIKSISGIRGTIGGKPSEALTPLDVVKFASAYGMWLKTEESPSKKVVIGRDARLSGKMISDLVSATLIGMGFDIVDLGLSTTPTVEMAVVAENAAGGIILTASHNPIHWNALKLLNKHGEFISAEAGEIIKSLAETEAFDYAYVKDLGQYTANDTYLDYHIQAILNLPTVNVEAIKQANFSVLIDAVNSSGGIAIPALLKALGVKNYKVLNGEPTGNFAHNPEPLPEHLQEISGEMRRGNYDIGIVVDPDVDRLALICEDGEPFGEEYTLVAVADYILNHPATQSKATVSNLSSTLSLKEITEAAGGTYAATPVGEVHVVKKMKELNAEIGGEGNGGIIYSPLHAGRDALVGIALFLSHLATFGKSVGFLRKKYPNYHIAKKKADLEDGTNVDAILEGLQRKYAKYPINTEDGVKIHFNKEWVHLRKSNTEPIIRIYAESEFATTAENLADKIIQDISELSR